MLYQNEFSRMKKIYEKMSPARRDMVGPMLALPLVVIVLFGIVLVPFGVIGVPGLVFSGLLAAAISAAMLLKVVDIRPELKEWRSGAPHMASVERPGDLAIRMLSVANDPGEAVQKAQKAARKA
jgi:hypothetical protein